MKPRIGVLTKERPYGLKALLVVVVRPSTIHDGVLRPYRYNCCGGPGPSPTSADSPVPTDQPNCCSSCQTWHSRKGEGVTLPLFVWQLDPPAEAVRGRRTLDQRNALTFSCPTPLLNDSSPRHGPVPWPVFTIVQAAPTGRTLPRLELGNTYGLRYPQRTRSVTPVPALAKHEPCLVRI